MLLDPRSVEIFRCIIEAYMETGEPIGSRTISQRLGFSLSAATIRHVMADLELSGLLFSPHTSAGRLPTEAGLRLFVDGLMEFGDLTQVEQAQLEERCRTQGKSLDQLFEETTLTLSGLSKCAGLVFAPKTEAPLKHLEFVFLNKGRAMVVMVTEDGTVENRILETSPHLSPSHLSEASNYLNHRVVGKSLAQAKKIVEQELSQHRIQLDELAKEIIQEGLGQWGGESERRALIVRGQAHLLEDVKAIEDLKSLQQLFQELETQESLLSLLEMTIEADGVQIFIGSDTPLFQRSGSAMIIAPYGNETGKVVGAIGVIGPKRMNYGRIIPMVDYTSKLLTRLISAD